MVGRTYRRKRYAALARTVGAVPRRRLANKYRRRYFRIRRQIGTSGLMTKVRQSVAVTAAGTTFSLWVSLRNPQDALDWTGLSALYDFYRVHRVKLKYTPYRPNDENTLATFRPLYIVTDQDDYDNTAFTDISIYQQYDRCAIKNLYRPWSYMAYVSKMISATRINQGTSGPLNVLSSGHMDINTKSDNGIISMRAEGLSNNVQYGDILITYYISFKARR